MPAPQPAPHSALVIDLQHHRRTTGRWSRTTANAEPADTRPDHALPDHPVLAALANDVEMHLNAAGHTLTDSHTATVYAATCTLFRHTLKGAQAQGVITKGQFDELGLMLAGLQAAPEHV